MNLDELIKYVVWIVVFGIASIGIYLLFEQLGIL